jgi:hypothetical protein
MLAVVVFVDLHARLDGLLVGEPHANVDKYHNQKVCMIRPARHAESFGACIHPPRLLEPATEHRMCSPSHALIHEPQTRTPRIPPRE